MLVDAGARDFTCVDPTPSKIIETPPAISFTVSTAKFQGRVTILYDRAGDTYVVELHHDGELVDRHDEVYFDILGEVLERLIDDGRWRLIDVSVIGAKSTRRRQAVAAWRPRQVTAGWCIRPTSRPPATAPVSGPTSLAGSSSTRRRASRSKKPCTQRFRSQSVGMRASSRGRKPGSTTAEIGRASCRERVCQYV